MMPAKAKDDWRGDLGTVKEIVTALVMAFAMAFVFRAFALEAFLIPTGSMAPTLLGAHVRAHSHTTGAQWPVGPWEFSDAERTLPAPVQGSEASPVVVHDPYTGPPGRGLTLRLANQRAEAGDRIFVFKYLYSVFEPRRWDVVVFKYPQDPAENYVKRLIGLPGEQVALIDGDVFTRPGAARANDIGSPWAGEGWGIRRKDERTQRALWQPIYDSRFVARYAAENTYAPWAREGQGWKPEASGIAGEGSAPLTLRWDTELWPITDFLSYNENREDVAIASAFMQFPTADLAMRAVVKAQAPGLRVAAEIEARGFVFRGEVDARGARVKMRPVSEPDAWQELDAEERPGMLAPGIFRSVEFWHVDQAVWLFVDGRLVAGGAARGAYEWGPAERVRRVTNASLEDIARGRGNPLANTGRYWPAKPRWVFDGAPFAASSLHVARDIYYRADAYPAGHSDAGGPALGTHPSNSPVLGGNQYFVAGDNSASSSDSRLWDAPHEWVRDAFEHATMGIVPRELLVGKAILVYFPSIQRHGRVPVVDFGRMRFIW
jgi:signal peptidase I